MPADQTEYKVYKMTCSVNGKVYVGCTKQRLSQRMHMHRKLAKRPLWTSHSKLHHDIAKYGFDAFEVAVMCVVHTKRAALILEGSLQQHLNSYWPDGYNLERTGVVRRAAPETTAKISAKLKGKFKGEASWKAKLTWDQVNAIRAEKPKGKRVKELAAQLSVCPDTVSKIVRGARW